jgi:hypothetical protein
MKRKNPQQTDIRAPISIDLLKHMIKSLLHACSSHYEAHMFSAAFSLAYFDMLRVSEISLKNRSDESGQVKKRPRTYALRNGSCMHAVKI